MTCGVCPSFSDTAQSTGVASVLTLGLFLGIAAPPQTAGVSIPAAVPRRGPADYTPADLASTVRTAWTSGIRGLVGRPAVLGLGFHASLCGAISLRISCVGLNSVRWAYSLVVDLALALTL